MRIFEQLAARRPWAEEERLVLDQVQRLADEVIAPAAAGFDRSGEFQFSFGATSAGIGDMTRPRSIAFDSEGHVYVTDAMPISSYVLPIVYFSTS